jgi:hypothetical protein
LAAFLAAGFLAAFLAAGFLVALRFAVAMCALPAGLVNTRLGGTLLEGAQAKHRR